MGWRWWKGVLLLPFLLVTRCTQWNSGSAQLPDLYWNTTNPMFDISNTDHIMDVVQGQPAPKINIICPHSVVSGQEQEQHVIYSVEKEEWQACRITRPQPRIVAYCTQPNITKMFTLSFRSFSPLPGVLEFLPGQDYYFISTSLPGDLHSRAGGYCLSHNMKVVFKVLKARPRPVQEQEVATVRINSAVKPLATTLGPSQRRRQERRKRRRRKELEELEELATSSSPALAREPRDRQLSLAKTSFSSGQAPGYSRYSPACLVILLAVYAF